MRLRAGSVFICDRRTVVPGSAQFGGYSVVVSELVARFVDLTGNKWNIQKRSALRGVLVVRMTK